MFAIRALGVCVGLLTASCASGAELPVAPAPVAVEPELAPPNPRDYIAWVKYNAELWKRADEYFTTGRYKRALDCYTRWTAASGCGTCDAQMHGTRVYRMAMCHVHLNDLHAAVRVCVEAYTDCGWSCPEVGIFLFRVYRDAGQLDDLWKMMDEAEKPAFDEFARAEGKELTPAQRERVRKYLPTWSVREMGRLAQLGEKRDLAALIALCQAENTIPSAAAVALANGMRAAAKKCLNEPLAVPFSFPKPKPGSLPKTLPK